MTRPIAVRIPRPGRPPMAARRNHHLRAQSFDLPEEGVGTVSRVTDHRRRGCHGLQQDRRPIDVGLFGPVKVQASGLHGASAIMWILVPQPPRDRPNV